MTSQQCRRIFWLFLSIHLLIWTILPSLVRHNLPVDTLEGITWGQVLQWGYDKNPLVNAWMSRCIVTLFGTANWPFYAVSQLCVVTGLWASWRLAQKVLKPEIALLGILALLGVYYFNIAATQFNDNVIELALWPLMILCFYNAVILQEKVYWVLVGVLAALAFLTKYLVVILLCPMLLWLVFHRASFKRGGVYIAAVIFLAMISPHLYWLTQHDYITVKYALMRGHHHHVLHWSDHLINPLYFAGEQLAAFLPAVLLCLTFGLKREKKQSVGDGLFTLLALGPLVVTLLISLIAGFHLEPLWGVPLLSLWGVWLLSLWQPKVTLAGMKRFLTSLLFLMLLMAGGYFYAQVIGPYRNGETGTGNYPGRAIAKKVTALWHQQVGGDLAYVAGPRWIAGNVAFYSKDDPQVYIRWKPHLNPHIDEKMLRQKGAVFIWQGDLTLAPEILKRFRHLAPAKHYTFKQLTGANVAPIDLNIALLPPQGV